MPTAEPAHLSSIPAPWLQLAGFMTHVTSTHPISSWGEKGCHLQAAGTEQIRAAEGHTKQHLLALQSHAQRGQSHSVSGAVVQVCCVPTGD